MASLDYTLNSDAVRSDFERGVYSKPSVDVYALIDNNSIKLDEALWYQAWQGFLFLKRLPYQRDNLAAEVRRVVFRNILLKRGYPIKPRTVKFFQVLQTKLSS